MIRKILCVLLLPLFSFAACKSKQQQTMEAHVHVKPAFKKTKADRKFLALGDSYTIGESVSASDRFPTQTIAMVAKDNLNFAEPEYIAKTGWTTTDLSNALSQSPPKSETAYDIVTLLIGVNNQVHGGSSEDYAKEFGALVDKAIQYAGGTKGHVIALSIPDYSVTPFAKKMDQSKISKQIDEFNQSAKKVAHEKGVTYMEITDLTRRAKKDSSLIAGDGLHPSAKEYTIWATNLAAMVRSVQ